MEDKTDPNAELGKSTRLTDHQPTDQNFNNNKHTAYFVKLFNSLIIKSCWLSKNMFFNMLIAFFLLSFTTWILFFIIFGKNALPGGIYFSLIILLVASHIFGYLFKKMKLPSLLGHIIQSLELEKDFEINSKLFR